MDYVARIHLKRDDNIRKELIDFLLLFQTLPFSLPYFS